MKSFVWLAFSIAICRTVIANTTSIPTCFRPHQTTPCHLSSAEVQQELGGQISNTSAIFGPDDSRYTNATTRWNTFAVPQVQVVVEPGQESDVSTIVSRRILPSTYARLSDSEPRFNTAMRTTSTSWPSIVATATRKAWRLSMAFRSIWRVCGTSPSNRAAHPPGLAVAPTMAKSLISFGTGAMLRLQALATASV